MNQQRLVKNRIVRMIGARLVVVNRILIAGIGIVVGVVTCVPNSMLCGSGSAVVGFASTLGVLASLSFVIGAIYYPTWWTLLPGLILQVSALAIPAIPCLEKLHQQQLSEMSAKFDQQQYQTPIPESTRTYWDTP